MRDREPIRERLAEAKDILERICMAGASGVFRTTREITDEIVTLSADLIGVMVGGDVQDADAVLEKMRDLARRVCPAAMGGVN